MSLASNVYRALQMQQYSPRQRKSQNNMGYIWYVLMVMFHMINFVKTTDMYMPFLYILVSITPIQI